MAGDFKSYGGRDPVTGRFTGKQDRFYGSRRTRKGTLSINEPAPVPEGMSRQMHQQMKNQDNIERDRLIEEAIAKSKFRARVARNG